MLPEDLAACCAMYGYTLEVFRSTYRRRSNKFSYWCSFLDGAGKQYVIQGWSDKAFKDRVYNFFEGACTNV